MRIVIVEMDGGPVIVDRRKLMEGCSQREDL